MLCILKTIFAWAVLVLVGINLLGLVVRGLLWAPPSIPTGVSDRLTDLLDRETKRLRLTNVFITMVPVALTIGLFVALVYFWNIGLALAAAMIFVGRLPDLFFELRTGTKINRPNAPMSTTHIIGFLIMLAALPLVWYSLCLWNTAGAR